MPFKFAIPIKNIDLQTPDKNSYCVTRISAPSELPELLKYARLEFRQNGPSYIIDHFDTFYSVIEANDCPIGTCIKAFDVLYESIDKLARELAVELKKSSINDEARLDLANVTKMLIYLMVNIVKSVDLYINNGANDGGKTCKKLSSDFDSYNWNRKRKDGLDLMYVVSCLPLENLYDPPVIEEDFANLICEMSYRTIEQQYVKEKRVAETAFQILGTAIKRYNHAMVFPVKILQIVSDKDYSIRQIAESSYTILYDECGINSIFDVLIKELAERLIEGASDSKLSKHYSQFLSDLGNVAPKLMLPHLSDLGEELLNHEPYSLRNALLQIMGDIVATDLSSEGLAEELKETRDEFLDFLFDHIHDTNAHVRSKVLQIWNHLKSEGAVPLSRIHQVLERTVGRLEDKSSMVRKNATTLLKSFLEHNPFSSRLTLEQLQAKYDEADLNLQDLRKKQSEVIPQLEKFEEEWENLSTDIYTMIINNIKTQVPEVENEHLKDIAGPVGELLKDKKYKEALELVRKGDAVNEEQVDNLNFEDKCQYYLVLLKSYYAIANRPNDYADEITKAEDTVKFYFDFIQYTTLLNSAVPKLEEMLMSKTNSDVFEAIDFFTAAYQFGIKGCESGMHKMIFLVWSDKEKREAVTSAYKKVLFTTDKIDRAHAAQVVENLSRFIENLTYGHYSAFEELMKEWVENEIIDNVMIQVMFERYTKKLPNTTENDSRLALQLLVLSSVANPRIVRNNLDFLIRIGIEERGLTDPRVFMSTLDLLINSVEKEYERPSKYNKRYKHQDDIVDKIISNFKRMFFTNNDIDFDNVCIKTFNFIYRLVDGPDVFAQMIVVQIFEKLKVLSKKLEKRLNDADDEVTHSQTENKISLSLPTSILSRFIYMIGYVAMKEMIYLDIDVYSNIKYREELKNEMKRSKSKTINKILNPRRATLNQNMDMSASNALKRISIAPNQQESIEEEDLVGASADDAIAEQITFICETEMLYSNECLFQKFHPLIVEICQYINRYKDDALQQSVVLSMIHLMSVSPRFCEANVPFVMNIFNLSKNKQVKANIIIGLADFTFRFPNVIEPWTSHLYSTLHEEDTELRLTAVKMLSHLILHEMIRVKGQISDLAMCLVDPVAEIKVITEQFFKEIAQKSNILYNVLPDIISRLSDTTEQVEEGKYQLIMKFIIALIQKDKQVESLVEKLCLRFKVTHHERQWRDVAYCLSLLSYNEKTIKKLIEHIPCFKDKIQINEIYDSFKLIITNTAKQLKPELKVIVQELERKLEECLSVKDELLGQEPGQIAVQSEDESPSKMKAKIKPKTNLKHAPARTKKGGRAGGRGRRDESSSGSEDSDFENRVPLRKGRFRTDLETECTARSSKKTIGATKVIADSDTSDSDEQPQPKRKVRGKRQ
ncbi:condensin complex subunit 1 [Culicoides brevitarsis]|uniref:condensin complex subunit 1 n=1 Tax=Culicoides brevitarsis TaxID=469753 RepID=UPI00307C7E1D